MARRIGHFNVRRIDGLNFKLREEVDVILATRSRFRCIYSAFLRGWYPIIGRREELRVKPRLIKGKVVCSSLTERLNGVPEIIMFYFMVLSI